MKVFVDADNCSKDSRKIILKSCSRNKIELFLVANREIPVSMENVSFTMVVCSKEKDSADNHIVENSISGDMAVTRDILLAKRLLEKNVFVMNDKGKIFTKENIGEFIEQRELSLQMKQLGISTGSMKNRNTQSETAEFSKQFNTNLLKMKLN